MNIALVSDSIEFCRNFILCTGFLAVPTFYFHLLIPGLHPPGSLCSRMLGQRPASEDVSAQYGMSSPAFFKHYPTLKPFLQGALERAATDLHESRLSLHPSLYPILTLLAKLQPGAQEQTQYAFFFSFHLGWFLNDKICTVYVNRGIRFMLMLIEVRLPLIPLKSP